ncbi:MAG TPA: YdeI/OmpD-associated family protein [Thermoanaerobaculia bacterium]|nr:YdeI/OmpD-associated family protein [Thermoanaerobaculia bacterium]
MKSDQVPSIELDAVIERKDSRLPRYIVIPSSLVAPWGLTNTTVLEGTLNGMPLGRHTIKPWDEERWFIGIPEPVCRKAGVDTGASVHLVLRPAEDVMPEELQELLDSDAEARSVWAGLTRSQQRMLREEILQLKKPESRRRRALRDLRRSNG